MKSNRKLVIILAGINVVLLAGVLQKTGALPSAFGQVGGGRRGSYVCVTAKASGRSYDVLYILDMSSNKLHAMFPSSPPNTKLIPTSPRDLKLDFETP